MTSEKCSKYMTASIVGFCNDEYYNGTEQACKYEEQPLCEDIGCEVTAVDKCMTTTNHKQYTTNFPEYTCNNDSVSKNKEDSLCAETGCENQVEGDCISEQKFKKHTTTLPRYNCTAVHCKGNERVSKYEEQKLCEDIGCEDQTDGQCMTRKTYDKTMPDST